MFHYSGFPQIWRKLTPEIEHVFFSPSNGLCLCNLDLAYQTSLVHVGTSSYVTTPRVVFVVSDGSEPLKQMSGGGGYMDVPGS